MPAATPDPRLERNAKWLDRVTSNLDNYIERRAAELAEPMIQQAEHDAEAAIRAADAKAQRQEDLLTEMRRQIVPLERHAESVQAVLKLCSEADSVAFAAAEATPDWVGLVRAAVWSGGAP
jgi:chromosome segregation ATPase